MSNSPSPMSASDLSSTAEYQARFRYRTSPRTSDSIETLTTGQLGHMVETMKDAALFMRHVMVHPHLDVNDDRVYKNQNPAVLPSYLTRIASNFLVAGSFSRGDITGRASQPKSHPDVVAFMNTLHGAMRGQTLKIGKAFLIPKEIEDIVSRYDAVIHEYQELLKQYPNPDGQLNYKRIPRKVMKQYAEKFNPLADELELALGALPGIEVEVEGQRHTLPNNVLLNDRLDKTYPAATLWAFRTLGHGAADHHKRPATLEYEARQRTLIGAQSMITDTMQGLFNLAKEKGFVFEGCDINREQLKTLVTNYARSFQLLLNFCRTADCGYDVMYQDLESFIYMGGKEPTLNTLDDPQETALMLRAVERRLSREDKNPALRTLLHKYADEISKCSDMDAVKALFNSDVNLQRIMARTQKAVEEANLTSALPVLALLEELIPEAKRSISQNRIITDRLAKGTREQVVERA